MLYLVDSNVLLRLPERLDPNHTLVRTALRTLLQRGDTLCYTPQNLAEFWNVNTRPASSRGGFGLSQAEAERRTKLIERLFVLLPDNPAVHSEWRRLVVTHAVQGVQVHDARIVASCLVHGANHILTFNTVDFARYPMMTAVHPANIW